METVASAIKSQKPFFKFRTWAGAKQEGVENPDGTVSVTDKGVVKNYPNMAAAKAAHKYLGQEPLVNDDWQGVVQYNMDAAVAALDDTIQDNTAAVEEQEAAEAGEGEPAEQYAEEVDYVTLGQLADDGDKDAASQLQQLAKAQGIDPDQIESWMKVGEMLAAGDAGGGAGGSDTAATAASPDGERPTDWKPKVDEPYFFVPAGKRKRVEGAVTTVFEKSRTVNIRNLDDNLVERSVPWDKLFDEGN
jgi:hypothetical protein